MPGLLFCLVLLVLDTNSAKRAMVRFDAFSVRLAIPALLGGLKPLADGKVERIGALWFPLQMLKH